MFSRFDNLHRLYRDPEHGILAGVCAGIADYFGIPPAYLRLAMLPALLFFFLPTVIAYAVLALVLKPKPPALYRSAAEAEFWRGVRTKPNETVSALRHRFRGLEQRLARMESLVASEEYELRRKFRDIEP
ncbi:MAG TPA: envelope stress response membrane protein PspC [Alphaproteobacteria bacterium]|nr:envelope stress response membrane protein PspC [Alphaproteobacteria bacterium]